MAEFRFIGDPNAGGHGPATLELYGYSFGREDWTVVEGDLAERLSRHTHLEARRGGAKPAPAADDTDPVVAKGAAAKAAGKPRSVPPAYRGKPEEARWLAGYDEATG